MDKICMKGVGGVHYVTMYAKDDGSEYAEGMVLTLTGENEVGFGDAAGSPVFGVVSTVERNKHGQLTLGVQVSGFCDTVRMNATASKVPDVGGLACCNDKGLLIKADPAPAGAKGIVTALDTAEHLATIKL